MKAFATWTVLGHGPVEKHCDCLWTVQGTMPDPNITRVMSLARLADGRLVIHNAVALQDAAMAEIEAFGTPAFLVVPNAYHRMDARIYKDRYPAMKVLAPRAAHGAVAKVVPVDGVPEDLPEDVHVQMETLAGTAQREAVLKVTHPRGAFLVFNDVIMNVEHRGGPMGFMVGPTGRPAVPRVVRWFVIRNRRLFREHVMRLAATPNLRLVVVSHGRPLTEAPSAALQYALGTL